MLKLLIWNKQLCGCPWQWLVIFIPSNGMTGRANPGGEEKVGHLSTLYGRRLFRLLHVHMLLCHQQKFRAFVLSYWMSLWCSKCCVTTDSTVPWHSNYTLFFETKWVLLARLPHLIMLMRVHFCILEEKKKEGGGEPVFEIMENCERFSNFTYCSELKRALSSSGE